MFYLPLQSRVTVRRRNQEQQTLAGVFFFLCVSLCLALDVKNVQINFSEVTSSFSFFFLSLNINYFAPPPVLPLSPFHPPSTHLSTPHPLSYSFPHLFLLLHLLLFLFLLANTQASWSAPTALGPPSPRVVAPGGSRTFPRLETLQEPISRIRVNLLYGEWKRFSAIASQSPGFAGSWRGFWDLTSKPFAAELRAGLEFI